MSNKSSYSGPNYTRLIEKHQAAVPRYTSYPTAPNFNDSFKIEAYQEQVLRSNQTLLPRDLSIYVHIPFCHSLCYFCGCNKVITQCGNNKVEKYVERLLREIELRAELFDRDRRVTQIHFGGGTPNFLSNQRLREILEKIASQFHLDLPSRLEVGIEIDPRSINPEGIYELAELGFNRFSIGVQDFSRDVQIAINRVQSEEATLRIIEAATQVSSSVNVDLISGLPKQTLVGFSNTLERIVDSGVTRIAAYNFAYLPERIKAQKLIDPKALPSVEMRTQLAETARQILVCAGYIHIGLDHFASPTDSLALALKNDSLQRNFQGYTTHAQTDLIGLGVSAIGQTKYSFNQNVTEISQYSELIDRGLLPISKGAKLSNDDVLTAYIIQQIMCKKTIDLSCKIESIVDTNHEGNLSDYFIKELASLGDFCDDGLIKITSNQMTISEQGSYFRRQIAAKFDRYLPQNATISKSAIMKRNVVKFSQAL